MADDSPDDVDSEESNRCVNLVQNTKPATFVIGEKCFIRSPTDNKLRAATIKKFSKTSLVVSALVSFTESNCKEWIDVKKLLKTTHLPEVRTEQNYFTKEKTTEDLTTHLFSPSADDKELGSLICLDDEDSDELLFTCKQKQMSSNAHFPHDICQSVSSKHALSHDICQSVSSRSDEQGVENSNERKYKVECINQLELSDCFVTAIDKVHDKIDNDVLSDGVEKPYFPKVKAGQKVPFFLTEAGVKPEVKVPGTINRYLRDYQMDGVLFLYKHYTCGHGALLADDMGLGKTVQVISFVAALLGRTGTNLDLWIQKPDFIRKMSDDVKDLDQFNKCKPFLVIGPACVLYNWLNEFEMWGYFRVRKYHQQFKSETLIDLRHQRVDVVVTTYETFRDNVDELNHFEWEAVFADEVHKIKGLKTEVTKSLRKISCLRRFGLSGTPLQNNIQELWSLLDWCYPGCLGDLKTFTAKYCNVIETGQKHNATRRQLAEARRAQTKLSVVRDKWMLRRTKSLIKPELPKISELVVYCKPTSIQVSVYKAILDLEGMDYILKQNEPCPCGSKKTRKHCCYKKLPLASANGKSVMSLTLSFMHLLLKAANHIALLLPHHTTSENQRKEAEKVCDKVFSEHQEFIHQTKEAAFQTLSDPKYSGKMKVLQGLLSVFKKQRSKVLIFSYSTHLLDIIETYVLSMGYEYYRLDGQTSQSKRLQYVTDFNNDPNIFLFLISTRAGGVGLNLTGANVVVIFDPNWNPSHDLQAQDRAYRIGQRRDVTVYRLITCGTIEEHIYLRQVHKQQLGNVAVSNKKTKRLFYNSELFGIDSAFHLRTGDECLTEDILKRHSKVEQCLKSKHHSENYYIEKYVPLSTEDKKSSLVTKQCLLQEENKKKEDKKEEDKKEEEALEYDDSEDSFGLSYVCSQMAEFDEEYTVNEKKTKRSEGKVESKTRVNCDVKTSTRSRSKRAADVGDDDEEQSVNDFLDDLLASKLPSTSYLPTENKNNNRKSAQVLRSIGRKHLRDKAVSVTWKTTERNLASFEDNEEDILGGLWQEMESVSSIEYRKHGRNVSNDCSSSGETGMSCRFMKGSVAYEKRQNVYSDRKSCGNYTSIKQHKTDKTSTDKSRCEHYSKQKRVYLKQKHTHEETLSEEDNDGSTNRRECLMMEDKAMESDTMTRVTSEREASIYDYCVRKTSTETKQRKYCDISKKKTPQISVDRNKKNTRCIPVDCNKEDQKLSDTLETFESVTDVFAECGVIHLHHNQKVTGSSKAEDYTSLCVMKDVFEDHQNSEALAGVCQPKDKKSKKTIQRSKYLSMKLTSKKCIKKRKKQSDDSGFFYGPRRVISARKTILIGQTPKSIKRQHFLRLASYIQKKSDPDGEVDPVSFAREVLISNKKKHIRWLQMYYSDPELGLESVILQES